MGVNVWQLNKYMITPEIADPGLRIKSSLFSIVWPLLQVILYQYRQTHTFVFHSASWNVMKELIIIVQGNMLGQVHYIGV